VSQTLPDIILSKKLEMTKVNYATSVFDQNSVVICGSEGASVVSLVGDELEEKKINVQNSVFAFPLSSGAFAVLSESRLFAVSNASGENLEAKEIFAFPENFVPTYCAFLDLPATGAIVLSSATETYFGLTSNPEQFVKSDKIIGITKIVNYGTDLYFTRSDSPSALYHIELTGLSEFMEAEQVDTPGAKEGIPIVDIEAISQKMCVVLYEKSVFCTDSNKIDNFADHIAGKKLFKLPKKLFFLVIGKSGRIVIYKHPEIAQQTDAKETLKKAELSDLHKCDIQLICSPAEASFITFDEKRTLILWENLPNWWNAPNFLDMFGQNKAQNEASTNAQ
jgi:hypothetical protein